MQEYDLLSLSNYDYDFTNWFYDNKYFLDNLYRFFINQLDYYSHKTNNALFDKGNQYVFSQFIYECNKDI